MKLYHVSHFKLICVFVQIKNLTNNRTFTKVKEKHQMNKINVLYKREA